MRCFVLLAACAAFTVADQTSDGLRAVFSAIGGPDSCHEPCVGDLIFAARELLFFKDTINNFKDLCHTYENASLCVASKELHCMKTSSFATDAAGIEELCEDKESKIQQQMSCIQKDIDNVLDDCNSQCWFTPALSNLVANSDSSSSQADAQVSFDKSFEMFCPATACFVSCLAREIDSACSDAGTEITSALLRPFFIDAGLMAGSNSEMAASSMESVPDSCQAFFDVNALVNMTHGTYTVDASMMANLQSSLATFVPSDDSSTTPSTTRADRMSSTTTMDPTLRASSNRRPIIARRFGHFGGRFGHFHFGHFRFHH